MVGDPEKKLKLTDARQRVLQHLTIDDDYPGTILHDFDALLGILRVQKTTLTNAQQLPMNLLATLNQAMKSPVELGIQRPQLKSYPHLQGLYLLARASGLTQVDTTGKKPLLVVDEALLQQWAALNPTERYGYLLATWFLRGFPEILGDDRHPFGDVPDNFRNVIWFIERYDLVAGLQAAGNRVTDELRYIPGLFNLGLLHLFGLIAVESGPPQPGEGWHVEKITLTPVGGALLSLLYTGFFSKIDLVFGDSPFDKFYNLLQSRFPALKNRLMLLEPAFREGTHIFKVTVAGVWRRIAINAHQSLDVLAAAILESVGFDEDHLYSFTYRDQYGRLVEIYHEFMDDSDLIATEVQVGDLPLSIGQTMIFLFDFGDHWEFAVQLEALEPGNTVETFHLLEAQGDSPEQYPDYEDGDWDDEDEDDDKWIFVFDNE